MSSLLLVDPGEFTEQWLAAAEKAGVRLVLLRRAESPAPPAGVVEETAGAIDVGALTAAARKYEVSGIFAVQEEDWITASEAAHGLNMPNQQPFANGDVFYEVQQRLQAIHPDAVAETRLAEAALEEALTEWPPPVWVRRSHGLGRPWRMEIREAADAQLATTRQTAGGVVSLQRPVKGPYYRVLGFRLQREFLVVEIVAEEYSDDSCHVPMLIHAPAGLNAYNHTRILSLGKDVARLLPQAHGYVEMRMALTEAGPVLLDISAAPCPEAALTQVVDLSLGIDLRAQALCVAAGERPDLSATRDMAAAACWLRANSGVVKNVRNAREALALNGVHSVMVRCHPGDTLRHVVDEKTRDAVGYTLAVCPLVDEALAVVRQSCGLIKIETENMLV